MTQSKRKTWAVPSSVYHIFYVNFKHQLLNHFSLKLEHFLRPFLRTRSHGRSAHNFRSNHRFLLVPEKGVKFLTKGGLIESTKSLFKNLKFCMVINCHNIFFVNTYFFTHAPLRSMGLQIHFSPLYPHQ